jgi:hypothetical protein
MQDGSKTSRANGTHLNRGAFLQRTGGNITEVCRRKKTRITNRAKCTIYNAALTICKVCNPAYVVACSPRRTSHPTHHAATSRAPRRRVAVCPGTLRPPSPPIDPQGPSSATTDFGGLTLRLIRPRTRFFPFPGCCAAGKTSVDKPVSIQVSAAVALIT